MGGGGGGGGGGSWRSLHPERNNFQKFRVVTIISIIGRIKSTRNACLVYSYL